MLKGGQKSVIITLSIAASIHKYAQGFQGSVMCLANAYVVTIS